ncbi:MAG: hypothetical protein JW395_3606 [Nitrospira sp.]|nr:hypothetical protein [Nitrospira sp.]
MWANVARGGGLTSLQCYPNLTPMPMIPTGMVQALIQMIAWKTGPGEARVWPAVQESERVGGCQRGPHLSFHRLVRLIMARATGRPLIGRLPVQHLDSDPKLCSSMQRKRSKSVKR